MGYIFIENGSPPPQAGNADDDWFGVITTGPSVIMATGYSIKKLGFGQPMMILDHVSMKKRNNREAAAKHKQTRLQEEYE